jgi:hypothetical protein
LEAKTVATKLANPDEAGTLANSGKQPFSIRKKRLTGREHRSADEARAAVKETPQNRAPAEPGTPHAIKDSFQSPTATAAEGGEAEVRSSKVGRNRRGRRSTSLTLAQVRNIMAAVVFTAKEHRPLNRHTTIHFDAAGIADPVAALRAYTKLMRDWLRMQGAPFAYIWVREAGEHKGEHAHLLLHVPPDLTGAFARRERGWRKRIGATRALGAFRSTPVGRSYRHAESGIQFGEHYSDHLAAIVSYLCKGAEARAVRALRLSRVEPGGELWGKRTGMSENIGRAARQRAVTKIVKSSGGGG